MQGRRLIAANWKMNPPPSGWAAADAPYRSRADVDVVVFPSCTDIPACVEAGVVTGAQCGRAEPPGAFTGDVSMTMLAAHGCRYVLCGHSERRKYHRETDAEVASQARAALAAGLVPVVCIGETSEERSHGKTRDVIRRQAESIPPSAVVAYEPVWAIGTGVTPAFAEAQEVHAFIRSLLPDDQRDVTRILYGGSVTPVNAGGFLGVADVDGLLVGGASLDPRSFAAILDAAAGVKGA